MSFFSKSKSITQYELKEMAIVHKININRDRNELNLQPSNDSFSTPASFH